jgi:hypothetical protein
MILLEASILGVDDINVLALLIVFSPLKLKVLINVFWFVILGSPVTRWASVAFGAGVGIGSAYTDCSRLFDGSPAKLATPGITETPAHQVGLMFFTNRNFLFGRHFLLKIINR